MRTSAWWVLSFRSSGSRIQQWTRSFTDSWTRNSSRHFVICTPDFGWRFTVGTMLQYIVSRVPPRTVKQQKVWSNGDARSNNSFWTRKYPIALWVVLSMNHAGSCTCEFILIINLYIYFQFLWLLLTHVVSASEIYYIFISYFSLVILLVYENKNWLYRTIFSLLVNVPVFHQRVSAIMTFYSVLLRKKGILLCICIISLPFHDLVFSNFRGFV